MSRGQNYEFQEWWNKQREKNHEDLFYADASAPGSLITVEISNPAGDRPADKDRSRSACLLSWVCLLRFQQLANSIAWPATAFLSLPQTANRRISSADTPADSFASRLYRIIRCFLVLVILLLCVELVAYFKGWHFSPPSAAEAETAVEFAYAKWLEIRADYLAPPLQSLANMCIILFLIRSVDRVVLMLGCFWIKIRRWKPKAVMEYPPGRVEEENVKDYPVVLVQIPMCNEREPPMPTWAEPPFHSDQSHDCFINPYWDKSADQTIQFDSAFSSMVSSPAASNSNVPGDSSLGRELIGRLGNIRSSGEISPVPRPLLPVSSFISGCGNSSANASCYSIPLISPPKPNLPAELYKGSPLLSSSVDPGFAERAARFSCFGSRSFNGRTSHLGLDNNVTGHGSKTNPLLGNSKLPRVSSSPSLKALPLVRNSSFQHRPEMANSQDESTVSEANLNGNSGFKTTNDLNPRKRKTVSKGKTKNAATGTSANATKVPDANEDSNSKKYKQNEGNGSDNASIKTEEEAGRDEKQGKNIKPAEPPKDYIHVRARRGQAIDSHSLAERVRREKISERMKVLQDLVPGCNKVTGKALMLDEIINYVQSLQRQVEVPDANEDSNSKKYKQNEENGSKNALVKTEEEAGRDEKLGKDTKPAEPPKDYIHVRARRGQATDSHSLAERVRREKISERMKLLQDLVPGCNKVIGKALMLDEIINYVQSLQRQVEVK